MYGRGGQRGDRETFFSRKEGRKRKTCWPTCTLSVIPLFLQFVLMIVCVGRELDLFCYYYCIEGEDYGFLFLFLSYAYIFWRPIGWLVV